MGLFAKLKTFRENHRNRGFVDSVANLFGHRRRRWACEHQRRVHIEIRDLEVDEFRRFAGECRTRLEPLEGVESVRVNGIAGRMVVSIRKALIEPSTIVDIVEAIEEEQGLTDHAFDPNRHYPADAAPALRKAVTVFSDAMGGTLGVGLNLIGYKRSSVEFDLSAFVTLVDNSPKLRRPLEKRFGTDAVETALGSINAYVQALGSGPIGPYIDMVFQSAQYRALDARSAAWRRREPALCATSESATFEMPETPPRPEDLPEGPIEKYADEAWFASLGGFVVGLADTHDLEAATSPLFSGLPKAARYGREGFRAEIMRVFSDRDFITVNPSALERLDRIDTVVIEGDLLLTGALRLGRIEPLDGFAEAEVRRAAHELFDPESPLSARGGEGAEWTLAPFDDLDVEADDEAVDRVRELGDASGPLLGLVHVSGDETKLAAIVPTRSAVDPAAEHLLKAARSGGLHVVIATPDTEAARSFGPDSILETEHAELGESVRELQRDGRAVAVVAANSIEALVCSDLGIGVPRGDGDHFWASDVICGDDLSEAGFVLEACEAARDVSERAVMLAGVGAMLGAFVSLSGLEKTEPGHVMLAVNAASVTALASGIGAAIALDNRERPSVTERTPWHRMEVDEVFDELDTQPDGLPEQRAQDRYEAPQEGDSRGRRFVKAVGAEVVNPLTPVLAGAAAVSAVVGSVGDAGMVGAAVAVNAFVGGFERFKAEEAVSRLETREQESITVFRDGERRQIDVDELVRGDIVLFEAGDVVPADCRIMESDSLEVDESSLTGESLPVTKSASPSFSAAVAERSSMLYESTSIAAGDARAIVVATGMETESRRGVLASRGGRVDESGVEARLREFTDITLPVSSVSGALVFLVGMMRNQDIHDLVDVGVGLAVAAVPEGLPLLSTIAQLSVARRLSDRGILVRNPRAVEGLGRVDVICADKTGTLTVGELHLDAVSDGSQMEGFADGVVDWQRDILAAALRASPFQGETELPHPTDQAVVTGIEELGVTRASGDGRWEQTQVMPFEPGRSFHASKGQVRERHVVSVKGAPEVVIARCRAHRRGDQVDELDEDARAALIERADEYAGEGLRILAVAERGVENDDALEDTVEGELHFLGFLALSDPVRPTSREAVERLVDAGISVVMITGDHPGTARRIGEELGLMEDHRVLTGPDIEHMSDDQLDDVLPDTRVIARATPLHKVRIVEAFQRLGKVVAMTGDGANDASAIRLADVGIALGRDATSAAREAADVILLEAQIETLVEAIAHGRAMWGSVRDAVSVLIGGNLGEIGFTFLSSVLSRKPAFNARQLLLVNLLTDIAPAIAMAVRPPTDEALEALLGSGPEETLGETLDRDVNLRATVTTGGAAMAWLGAKIVRAPHEKASTTALLALVGSQLAQTVTAGKLTPTVLGASVGSAALLLGLVETPGVSGVFGCRPVGPICLSIAAGSSAVAAVAAQAAPAMLRQIQKRRDEDEHG
ncbi:MAG: HAD-IC family P-type ATPase [Myxococcota bacterium]